FGMCMCGFKKSDHGAKATEAEHLKVQLAPQGQGVAEDVAKAKDDISSVFFAGSSSGRNTLVGSGSAKGADGGEGPCGNFTLDMGGGFGMCTCGFSKEDHKKVV